MENKLYQEDDFKIDLSFPTKEFKRHLALEHNQRIIFSGPFGSGKTYFLNHFFENEKEKFRFIRLAPVNYSIAPNEDIFELIKFDILFHLLENELFPEDLAMPKELLLKHLSLLDPQKGLVGILEKANQTGADTLSLLTELEKVLEGTEWSQPMLDSKKGIKELRDFIVKIARDTGGLYEQNVLTQLLYYLIKKIGSENKEVVLIIDDLDRIDPEHIFRILNVFAAHFDIDPDKKENKFGFDRVILVCDLVNVRGAFASRYGQNVDFNGYIDKFYSRDVFCFENTQAITKIIHNVLSSIKVITLPDEKLDTGRFFPIQHDTTPRMVVTFILTALLRVNSINLRSILKLTGSTFYLESKPIVKEFWTKAFPIVHILELIRMFLGDGVSLKFGVQKCVFEKMGLELFERSDENNHLKLGLILPALLIPNNMHYIGPYVAKDGNTITFSVQKGGRDEQYWSEITGPRYPVDIFPPLLEVIEILQRKGLLK